MASKRVAVVTGANKGIGFEISKKLAAAGLHTVMAARK
jgi:NAD(P)-dependent dehydrogenase (short-subunit alcohol dehydrogenase family)